MDSGRHPAKGSVFWALGTAALLVAAPLPAGPSLRDRQRALAGEPWAEALGLSGRVILTSTCCCRDSATQMRTSTGYGWTANEPATPGRSPAFPPRLSAFTRRKPPLRT